MDKRTEAIALIGSRRSREGSIVFICSLVVLFLAMFVFAGFIVNAILSCVISGAITKFVLKIRTPAINAKVCSELGLDPAELNAEQYIIQ